jgi:tetratricopeptide (TPR) repeat protein
MNGPAPVDWSPALVVLALGLTLGATLVWRAFAASRTAEGTAPGLSLEVRDLAGKRDALVRQLREMEDFAGKRTPEQLARERYALELEAASVLLALDAHGAPERAKRRALAPAPSLAAEVRPVDRAGLRGFLWGIGSASGLLLLGLFVYQSAKPRETGGSVTGGQPMDERRDVRPSAGTRAAAESPPEDAEIKAALARDPNDVEAHLSLARLYLARREMMEAWNETKWVLERTPGNPQALAYQALVRLAMGQADIALDLLKKALAIDPNLVDGYAYTALVYVRMGRISDAEAVVATASKRFPDRAPSLRRLLADLVKQNAETDVAASTEPNPHPDPGAEADASHPGSSKGTASGRRISGTVEIDPSLLPGLAPTATLFVFVREAGFGAGPPVAVKRLPPTFPAHFELGEADAMMGQPFPDSLLVEARLDFDGDPTTRPPTDPKARLDDVKAGRADVRLVLRRP